MASADSHLIDRMSQRLGEYLSASDRYDKRYTAIQQDIALHCNTYNQAPVYTRTRDERLLLGPAVDERVKLLDRRIQQSREDNQLMQALFAVDKQIALLRYKNPAKSHRPPPQLPYPGFREAYLQSVPRITYPAPPATTGPPPEKQQVFVPIAPVEPITGAPKNNLSRLTKSSKPPSTNTKKQQSKISKSSKPPSTNMKKSQSKTSKGSKLASSLSKKNSKLTLKNLTSVNDVMKKKPSKKQL